MTDRCVYVRGDDFGNVALEGGHVDKARVDEGLDLSGRLRTQRVSDDLESHEGRMTLLEYHERRRTQLLRLLLVKGHFDEDRMHLDMHQVIATSATINCNDNIRTRNVQQYGQLSVE